MLRNIERNFFTFFFLSASLLSLYIVFGKAVSSEATTWAGSSQFHGKKGVNYDEDAEGAYLWCDVYDSENCKGRPLNECIFKKKCRPDSADRAPFCLHAYRDNSPGNVVMGCWTLQPGYTVCSVPNCSKHTTQKQQGFYSHYCCCNTHNCNHNVDFSSTAEYNDTTELTTDVGQPDRQSASESIGSTIYLLFAAGFAIFVGLLFGTCKLYMIRRQHRKAVVAGVPSVFVKDDATRPLVARNSEGRLGISKLELVGRGRFGEVYHGSLGDTAVAVKIFPEVDESSWKAETDIYSVEGLEKHENILRYIGSEVHGKTFWLITEFHAKGSLYQHLKKDTLSLPNALKVISTMLAGLSFLHEEKMLKNGTKKPCIVHRDFKSRNVLLKPDLTAIVADFGLAFTCENGKSPAEGARGQVVGTKRYMSPEVLEGATEFSAFAFRQIDVYAAALVVWEILTRTMMDKNDDVEEYRQPYEDELRGDPSIHELRTVVVHNKRRPLIRQSIFDSKIGCTLWKTVDDMWDAEPDGRITAGCALERINNLVETVSRENEKLAAASAEEAALSSMYNARDDETLLKKGGHLSSEDSGELDICGMYASPNHRLNLKQGFKENCYSLINNGYVSNNYIHPVNPAHP